MTNFLGLGGGGGGGGAGSDANTRGTTVEIGKSVLKEGGQVNPKGSQGEVPLVLPC